MEANSPAHHLTSAASLESLNSATSQAENNVRTLFVSGLPMDAKPRELYLLFRSYPGYESSLLKMTAKNGKSTSPVGFVTFATRQDADEARKALQGVRFDPECAQTIRLELARSNTKVPRPKQATPPTSQMGMLPVVGLQSLPQYANAGHELLVDSNHLLFEQQQLLALTVPQLAASQHLQMLPTSTLQQLAATQPLLAATIAAQQQQQAQAQFAQHAQFAQLQAAQNAAAQAAMISSGASTSSAPPCSTLFVANLSAAVSEEELRSLFKAFSGMVRLRLHAKGGSAVAFVEYNDIRAATQAMMHLNGVTVPSNDRGGMRIEYARNKMADLS
ncbi:unnamed protein product, partial [Mesorhabditis belari]|uniref:RRM domain-containing protein n=1 Tax=Mesorhabditis belari TaxID=2138241 RepID=A0AAF3FGM4_9BILA